MSRISTILLVLAATLVAAGCREHVDGRGAPAVFAKLDLAKRKQALQGGWTVLTPNGKLAIGIEGDDVTTYDGKKELHAKLRLDAPCAATFAGKDSEATAFGLVMKDGKAILGGGLGVAGQRLGKGAVVCTKPGVYVLDDAGACTLWKRAGQWRPEAGTCGFRREGGKTEFFAKRITSTEREELSAPVEGDVIWSELDDPHTERFASYAAAKAAVEAEAIAADPVRSALAAGGKVGDTSTVAGLIATFGADHAKLEGQKVTVTGVLLSSIAIDSGRTGTHAVLTTDNDHLEPELGCNTAANLTGVPFFSKVTVTGTVRAHLDGPVLDDCTVSAQR